jgi:hypothetical protein
MDKGGYTVAQLVESLCYKLDDRGFDFRLHNPSGGTMALRSTQFLTEMSTTNIFCGKGGRCFGTATLPSSGTLKTCPGLQWNGFYID